MLQTCLQPKKRKRGRVSYDEVRHTVQKRKGEGTLLTKNVWAYYSAHFDLSYLKDTERGRLQLASIFSFPSEFPWQQGVRDSHVKRKLIGLKYFV